MNERRLFDLALQTSSGATVRIGALLRRPGDYSTIPFGVTSLLRLEAEADNRLFLDGDEVAAWRRFTPAEVPNGETRDTCALVEFLASGFPDVAGEVTAPVAAVPLHARDAFGVRVSIFGMPRSCGVVSMQRRPVEIALSDDRRTLLRDAVAVSFDDAEMAAQLQAGRCVMTEDSRILGIMVGGSWDYCIVAPIQALIASRQFELGHREQLTAEQLSEDALEQERVLVEELRATSGGLAASAGPAGQGESPWGWPPDLLKSLEAA